MDLREYDILTMKKAHPCGGKRWQVLRSGADFRLRCLGCGRTVEGPRSRFEKNIRRLERDGAEVPAGGKTGCTEKTTEQEAQTAGRKDA